MTRAAVLGTGSWGTTFAAVLAEAGTRTTLWARRQELADTINSSHTNPDYLPGVQLPDSLDATHDPAEAMDGADLVVLAIPSQSLRGNLAHWAALIPPQALVVSLMKGVELETTKRMSEVIREVAKVPAHRVAVVTGPNLAREIAQHQPAATVVACIDEDAAERLQAACHTPYFRPYTNTDVIGCELAGAIKNVIALAVGMAQGMGFGDNTRASLTTRGLAEMSRLGVALGADPRTFAGLAGLGDLVATCSSPLSRNRTVGEQLGLGRPLAEIVGATRMIAEGVKSSMSIVDLARRHHVDMPIAQHVVHVVHDGMSPRDMVRSLMSREAKAEGK